mmetsp:Transcript_25764/g.54812  ORF Transcript_25764/g.54812 Transcript_25764/m.54812 type:complete len:379 (-) Transcript_25764:197-1333(-)
MGPAGGRLRRGLLGGRRVSHLFGLGKGEEGTEGVLPGGGRGHRQILRGRSQDGGISLSRAHGAEDAPGASVQRLHVAVQSTIRNIRQDDQPGPRNAHVQSQADGGARLSLRRLRRVPGTGRVRHARRPREPLPVRGVLPHRRSDGDRCKHCETDRTVGGEGDGAISRGIHTDRREGSGVRRPGEREGNFRQIRSQQRGGAGDDDEAPAGKSPRFGQQANRRDEGSGRSVVRLAHVLVRRDKRRRQVPRIAEAKLLGAQDVGSRREPRGDDRGSQRPAGVLRVVLVGEGPDVQGASSREAGGVGHRRLRVRGRGEIQGRSGQASKRVVRRHEGEATGDVHEGLAGQNFQSYGTRSASSTRARPRPTTSIWAPTAAPCTE